MVFVLLSGTLWNVYDFFPHLLYVIKFYQKTTATVKSFGKSGRAHSDGALEKNLISTYMSKDLDRIKMKQWCDALTRTSHRGEPLPPSAPRRGWGRKWLTSRENQRLNLCFGWKDSPAPLDLLEKVQRKENRPPPSPACLSHWQNLTRSERSRETY